MKTIEHWIGGSPTQNSATATQPVTDEPAQSIEEITEVMDTLAGVLGQEAEVRQDELPFGVGDVAGIGLVGDHALNYAGNRTKVHNTL